MQKKFSFDFHDFPLDNLLIKELYELLLQAVDEELNEAMKERQLTRIHRDEITVKFLSVHLDGEMDVEELDKELNGLRTLIHMRNCIDHWIHSY